MKNNYEFYRKDYEEAKKKYIANYEEYKYSFWGSSFKKNPILGETKWNEQYPTIEKWLESMYVNCKVVIDLSRRVYKLEQKIKKLKK